MNDVYMYGGMQHLSDKDIPIYAKQFIEYLQGHLNDALRIADDTTRPRASRIVAGKEAKLLRDMIQFIRDRA